MSSATDRRKNNGNGDEGGGANWMDTYGDLVTLLLTFFVLLFSFSNIDAQKWEALVGSFTGMSPIGVDPITPEVVVQSPIPVIGPVNPPADDESDTSQVDPDEEEDPTANEAISNLWEIYEHLASYIERGSINAELNIYEDEYIIRVVAPDLVFFETASAVVRPEAYPVLDTVIDMFLEVEHLYSTLNVEGHTDIRPINTAQYPSNWHVSVYRAVNVVSYFRDDERLDKTRIAAIGYGEEHPVAPNDTAENMARNRRVEFVVEAIGVRGD